MKNLATLISLFLCLGGGAHAASKNLAADYEKHWRTDFHKEISTTLAQKRVKGCGEYKYKKSRKNRNEFVVYCTSDGEAWDAYLVWPLIGEIMGPYAPDPALN